MKQEAIVGLVAIIAIAGLVMCQTNSTGMITTENVEKPYDPRDYQLGNDCYIGFKKQIRTMNGVKIRLWDTHSIDKYHLYVDEKGYTLCQKFEGAVPKEAYYMVCPPMTKCVQEDGSAICVQTKYEKVTYCD